MRCLIRRQYGSLFNGWRGSTPFDKYARGPPGRQRFPLGAEADSAKLEWLGYSVKSLYVDDG